jgi:hypothetical protein
MLSFLLSLLFSLQQNQRRGQNRFFLDRGWGGGGTTKYTHVSTCKNNKIKGEETKQKQIECLNFFLSINRNKTEKYVLIHLKIKIINVA